MAERTAVRVRMYRQGLGDCFLLTFDPGGTERHVLIDCGTLGATTTGVKLADVAKDIHDTTGRHIDLLIATHEHWDHVRGFHDQLAIFQDITFDHAWLAWTENPKDCLAKKIAARKEDLGTALAHAAEALTRSTDPASKDAGGAVQDILGFFGGDTGLGAAKFSESVNAAMNFVRKEAAPDVRFCKPGEGPFEESWLEGFRFYVMGPPYDEDALFNTGNKGSSELYGVAAGLKSGARFLLARQAAAAAGTTVTLDEREDFVASHPFDQRFRVEHDGPRARDMFDSTYFTKSEEWRQVEEDWLHAASDFALQLDDATNNTSLALAIERVSDGRVLLFPADAQQGNWLSWHDKAMTWTVQEGSRTREVRAVDLLSKTVFYKVGHHSSHNATAKAKGLELMNNENELVAFIPVDRKVALTRNPKGSWRMPAFSLYRRLLEKCQGRVVRSDLGWADDAANAADPSVEKEFVGLGKTAEWTGWKKAQQAAPVQISNLYIDYMLT